MSVKVAFIGMLMCTAALPAGAGETDRMVLHVSPSVAFAPANLVVRATIPADQQNRSVEIVAESDSFYRSSEIQLEGDRAPRTSQFEFRSLPPGTYEVRATVLGTRGEQRSTARQQVNVMSSSAGH
jgi:predicted phage tail protein